MSKPNILFIIADDHRASAIHAHGDPTVRTPTLDNLAAEGVSFRQNHIMGGLTGAVCVPTRACLLTGANVFRASVSQHIEDGNGLRTLNPELPLLPEQLRHANYHTFATGKWHNDKASFARGFDDGGKIFFGGMSDHDQVPVHDFDPSGAYSDDARYTGEQFSTDLFSDTAIRFLQEYDGERPFFLYLAFTAPHDPRTPPVPYAEYYNPDDIPLPPNFLPEHPFDNGEMRVRDEKLAPWPRTPDVVRRHIADYYGMISHMDARIGTVLDALQENGYGEETIIVYTADHGLALGQHGLMGKQNLYDHSIRVPLIARGPGLPQNQEVQALTYTYDLYPTLCELAGVPLPQTIDSLSLRPLIEDRQECLRESVYTLYKNVQRSVNDGEWKLIRYYPLGRGQTGTARVQLFHIAADPWEIEDLAAAVSQQAEVRRLAGMLTDWMQQVGDPLADQPALPETWPQ